MDIGGVRWPMRDESTAAYFVDGPREYLWSEFNFQNSNCRS